MKYFVIYSTEDGINHCGPYNKDELLKRVSDPDYFGRILWHNSNDSDLFSEEDFHNVITMRQIEEKPSGFGFIIKGEIVRPSVKRTVVEVDIG